MRSLHLVAVGVLLTGGFAFGANVTEPADQQVAKQVIHEVRMYPNYTIWDNIQLRVEDGHVVLSGQVSQPFKKADLQRLASRTEGVVSVTNDLEVLPTSQFDDRIRRQTARAIYGDPVLSRYRLQNVPPIHIIVNNGHVTLEGVVNTDMEKNVAGIRAGGASLSFGAVVNNLRVENPSAKPVS